MNVSLAIPSDADGLNLSGTVPVTASPAPPPLRVEFYLDGVLAHTATSAPYTWQWDTTKATAGTHKLRADAVYKSRRATAQQAVSVVPLYPPPIFPPTPTPVPTGSITWSTVAGVTDAGSGSASGTTRAQTLSGAVAVGDLIVVGAQRDASSAADIGGDTMTDSLGNVYTLMNYGFDSGHGQGYSTWYSVATVAGTPTITNSYAASHPWRMLEAQAYRSSNGAVSVDQYNGAAASALSGSGADNVTTPALVPTSDDDLSVAFFFATSGSATFTAAETGYTIDRNSGAGTQPFSVIAHMGLAGQKSVSTAVTGTVSAAGAPVMAAAALFKPVAAVPVTPPPPVTGMPLHGFAAGGMFRSGLNTSVRQFEENEMKTISQGTPCLVRIEAEDVIQELLNLGFDVSYILGGTIRGFGSLPGGSVSAYGDLAGQFAARWKGKTGLNGCRVRMIEIGGNEPNINSISAAQQVQILQASYAKIKAADPNLIVSTGGLAPSGTSPPRDYCTAMFAAGFAAGMIDYWQGHLYEDAQARGTWNTWDQHFPASPTGASYGTFPAGTTVREQLNSHGMSNVVIWSGESGRSDRDPTVMTNALGDFQRRRAHGEKVGPLLIFTMRSDWITLGSDAGFGLTGVNMGARNAAWTAVFNAITAGG